MVNSKSIQGKVPRSIFELQDDLKSIPDQKERRKWLSALLVEYQERREANRNLGVEMQHDCSPDLPDDFIKGYYLKDRDLRERYGEPTFLDYEFWAQLDYLQKSLELKRLGDYRLTQAEHYAGLVAFIEGELVANPIKQIPWLRPRDHLNFLFDELKRMQLINRSTSLGVFSSHFRLEVKPTTVPGEKIHWIRNDVEFAFLVDTLATKGIISQNKRTPWKEVVEHFVNASKQIFSAKNLTSAIAQKKNMIWEVIRDFDLLLAEGKQTVDAKPVATRNKSKIPDLYRLLNELDALQNK